MRDSENLQILFKREFFLFDHTLNSSEINTIKLGIPKEKTAEKIEKQVEIIKTEPKIEKKIDGDPKKEPSIKNYFSIEDFWLVPVANSTSIRLKLIIRKDENTAGVFHLVDNGKSIISAQFIGKQGELYSVLMGKIKVGLIRFDANRNAFFCGITSITPSIEICSSINCPPNYPDMKSKCFDFLIPSLRNVDGKKFPYPIPFGDFPNLYTHVKQGKREAVRLKSVIPPIKNSQPDFTFEGKLVTSHITNLIVIYEPKPDKNVLAMTYNDQDNYDVSFTFPLCPLQAFLACVCHLHDKKAE